MLLLCKALRPDRVLAASHQFIAVAMGEDFVDKPELDWKDLIEVRLRA